MVDTLNYSGIFTDISATLSDPWIQPVVETALKYHLITGEHSMFAPDRDVTRAEAFAMIMSSVCMSKERVQSFGETWQEELYFRASETGLTVRDWSDFQPNTSILRQELFAISARAADWAERTGGCDPKPTYCFVE